MAVRQILPDIPTHVSCLFHVKFVSFPPPIPNDRVPNDKIAEFSRQILSGVPQFETQGIMWDSKYELSIHNMEFEFCIVLQFWKNFWLVTILGLFFKYETMLNNLCCNSQN